VWNIARNSGAKLLFYANIETLTVIKEIQTKHPIACEFEEFNDWDDFLILAREFNKDDSLIIVLSRKDKPSFHQNMSKIPSYLNKNFMNTSYILIFPMQTGVSDTTEIDL
jgi:hypothetical protein